MKTSYQPNGFTRPENNAPQVHFAWHERGAGVVLGFLVLALCMVTAMRSAAAPYPPEGLATEWTQPNGTRLSLKVFGDEFYARTVTKDGFTVVFNANDNTYYYAEPGADGTSLVASGLAADQAPPQALEKDLKEPRTTEAVIRKANVMKYAPTRDADWAARVQGAQQRRAADPNAAPGVNPAPGDPLAAPITGSKVGLMILVQFPNDPATGATDPVNFPPSQAKIVRYCNETGYTDDGNTGSIRDYFSDQSTGLMTLTHLVTPIVTLPQPRNYYNYSDYPTNATISDAGTAGRRLIADAITKLKTDGFNFSSLTLGSGNRVVATSLLFAGPDSGVWAKGLWPHASTISDFNVGTVVSPRYISNYQITNVPTVAPVIGTVCHELGHLLLRYPDLYDYGGESAGAGGHCLMGWGNGLNSGRTPAPIDLYLKDVSGWANIIDIAPEDQFDAAMPSTGNLGYRIRKPGMATEYFLVENRGPGDRWAQYSPDQGIAIWHIDEVVWGNDNEQMTAAAHYQVSLEQADGLFDLENGRDGGDGADLFDHTGNFNNGTNPDAKWWSGAASGISISVLSSPAASVAVRFGAPISTATLTLDPVTRDAPAAGGTYDFAVSSNTSWSWTGAPSWITSAEAASQSGNQIFTYAVAVNPLTTSRTATLTLSTGGLLRTHVITQAGVVIDDHGDSLAAATVVGQNSTTAGNIGVAGDHDYFRINVSGSGTLLVQTTGTTDTYGDLLDGTGMVTKFDDDSGASTNFLISHEVTSGTYYLRVRNFYSDGIGGYQLVCGFSPTPVLTVNPVTQAASAGDASYSFSVVSNLSWTWSADAAWITSNEAAGQTGDQTFTYSALSNPNPAVRSGVITVTGGGITRTHTVTQAGAIADDHGSSMATATVIGADSATPGYIGAAGDFDYFRIDAASLGNFILQTTGTTDTFGYLYDSSGALLVTDDDAGVDANFLITRAVPAGTYYVAVKHFNGLDTGSYQLVSGFTAGATLTVSTSVFNVPAAGSTYGVNVNANTSWTWSSNVAWLTSSDAANQSGSRAFSFTVSPNTTATSRSGTITFTAGGLTASLAVVQAGVPGFANRLTQTLADYSQSSWNPDGTHGLEEASLATPRGFFRNGFDTVGRLEVETRSVFGTGTATNLWGNHGVVPQSGIFSATFSTTPSSGAVDTVLGFSNGPADWWDDLAASVRFGPSGTVDARNGGDFAALTVLNYSAGVSYLVEMEINVATKRYRVTVTPAGGVPVVIADDYTFRTEQAAVSRLTHFSYLTWTGGTQTVSGLQVPSLGKVTATNVWGNYAVAPQRKSVVASFWTTPSGNAVDTLLGFSAVAAELAPDLAACIRFNPQGRIDARNGGVFAAAAVLNYSAGVSYRITMEIEVVSKRYWATVTPAGGSPVLIANNYAFRTEQSAVTELSNFGYLTWTGGTQTIQGLVVSDFGAVTATNLWANHELIPHDGIFLASFSTIPSSSAMDTSLGFSSAAADFWDDLAAYVRFNPQGTIDARNGAVFGAESVLPYAAGVSYLVEMEINVPQKRYSVSVTPAGGSRVVIASNYAFRTEQNAVTALANFACLAWTGGTQSVRGFAVSGTKTELPPLLLTAANGPLVSSSSAEEIRVEKQIRLVPGLHATEEIITVDNLSNRARQLTIQLTDDYGSDSATVVHTTSSGDSVVGPDDYWFVSSDQSTTGISDDPSLMVSWI
ncbi:M6 family metalloprotease domain-containing protein, partial [bacterium]|nr:M6 family metalloprotease domain-containing protein [bacterium]